MCPIAFSFDGESRLYFLYVLGEESRKEVVTEQATLARFLVYRANTPFNWTSVLLTGPIDIVPEAEREAAKDAIETKWRPEVFERASKTENTRLYQFQIEARTGLKHVGLPPGLERESK